MNPNNKTPSARRRPKPGSTTVVQNSPPIEAKKNSKNQQKEKTRKEQKNNTIPAALKYASSSQEARITNNKGGCVVKHREYIADVLSSTTFNISPYRMNPGDVGSFPWLSSFAQAWEHYKFTRLRVVYLPAVGTTTAGRIALAPDFNIGEQDPEDFKDFMAARAAIAGPVYSELTSNIPLDSAYAITPWKYVRHANEYVADVGLVDTCLALLAVDATANNGVLLGSLFVEYTVHFKTQQVQRGLMVPGGILQRDNRHSTHNVSVDDNAYMVPFTQTYINTLVPSDGLTDNHATLLPGTYKADATIVVESASDPLSDDFEEILAYLGDTATGLPLRSDVGAQVTRNVVPNDAPRWYTLTISQLFTITAPLLAGVYVQARGLTSVVDPLLRLTGRSMLAFQRLDEGRPHLTSIV